MDLSRLRAGVDRLAGAVKRTDTTTPLMWGEWAVVQNPSIPEVVLESDWQQTPRPVRNAAGRLEQYQRVYVIHQGPITTVVAAPTPDTGWVAVTLDAAVGGSLAVRKIGPQVHLKGTVTHSGGWPTSYVTIGNLPSWARPPVYVRRAIGGYASGTPNLIIGNITTGGQVNAAAIGTGGSEAYFTGISWLTD